MGKQHREFHEWEPFCIKYHHIKEEVMNAGSILYLVLAVLSIGIASPAAAEDKAVNYLEFKGGIYSPSLSHDVDNFNNGNTTHLDSKTGFAGEVAVGHYLLPMLALELGAGYFQSKGSPAAEPGHTMLKVVPLVATGKVLLPLGIFEPYGLFGIGAYITDLDVSDNKGTFHGSTKITYGLHGGAGFNINFSNSMFVGVEGKYIWVEPSYGGQDIKLNGFITTADLGFRF
ncbi:MAG: outer membrane beta-barrel protein [Oryzomonas sp.]|uniref:outer membrane beta-barrel protein n=1 Tax=Oryzomonas sp. TaxID=2855186 RepID=UPI00283B00B5|nr:outer membrane beta-barrel protein [Oryzomonas sp.]MDR3579599.1 outer membrane beta-barrel protein [Oryzomonas sp.]